MQTKHLIVGSLIYMLLPACDFNSKTLNESTTQTEELSLEVAGSSPNELSDERMSAYVQLINGFGKRVSESKERYLKWCDEQTGPTGKEKNVYGLYDIDGYKNQIEAAKKLIPQNPALAIDKHANDYIETSLPLINLVNEADYYYEQENYKDDNFLKGKELHPKLMSAFNSYEIALEKFKTEYQRIYTERAAKQNEELRKQGKTLALDLQGIVNQSEVLLNELMPLAFDLKAKPAPEQLTSIQSKIDALEKTILGFDESLKSTPQEKLKEQFSSPNNLSIFSDDAKDFLKDIKNIYRMRKAGKDYNSSYEREVNSIGNQYDDLVQRMNFCGILI